MGKHPDLGGTQHQTLGGVLRRPCPFSLGTYSYCLNWHHQQGCRNQARGIQKEYFSPDPKQASLKHLQESLFSGNLQPNYTLPRDKNSSDSIQISIHNFGNFIKKQNQQLFEAWPPLVKRALGGRGGLAWWSQGRIGRFKVFWLQLPSSLDGWPEKQNEGQPLELIQRDKNDPSHVLFELINGSNEWGQSSNYCPAWRVEVGFMGKSFEVFKSSWVESFLLHFQYSYLRLWKQ